MFGRGRGRILTDDALGTPPRRPGAPPESVQGLSGKLAFLDPLFHSRPIDDILVFKAIHNFITPTPSPADIGKMAEYVLTKLLHDTCNCDTIAKYIYVASKNITVGENLILRKFFSQLEGMYTDSDNYEIIKGNSKYRNFVMVFSSMTHYTRNMKYPPFDDLINGLFNLMEPLIKSDNEEDLRILAISVVRYSKYLTTDWPLKSPQNLTGDFEALLNAIRSKITSRVNNITEVGLGWLMLALESSIVSGFDNLSSQARNHYKLVLGPSVDVLSVKNDQIKLPTNDVKNYQLEDILTSNMVFV